MAGSLDGRKVAILVANTPGFDKDNWPDMTNPDFGTRIYSFYKVKPYWE